MNTSLPAPTVQLRPTMVDTLKQTPSVNYLCQSNPFWRKNAGASVPNVKPLPTRSHPNSIPPPTHPNLAAPQLQRHFNFASHQVNGRYSTFPYTSSSHSIQYSFDLPSPPNWWMSLNTRDMVHIIHNQQRL